MIFSEHLQKTQPNAHEKQAMKKRCFAIIKLCAFDLQKRLPNATSLLEKIKTISPQLIIGQHAMTSLHDLPSGVFACSKHQLERALRYLQQLVGSSSDEPLLEF
ncbi:hypothetical protein MRX96_047112 [Rhipicephalus microplus]